MATEDLSAELSPFQRELVLSVCPAGTSILEATSSRPGPKRCPLRVRLALPGGGEATLYLRLDRSDHGVEREARLLPTLRRLGLPVADVLAGPVRDPEAPRLGAMAIYAELPGEPLLQRSWRAPLSGLRAENDALADQLLEGIEWIRSAGAALWREEAARLLPREGLVHELRWHLEDRRASSPDDPWAGQPWLAPVVRALEPLAERAARETPASFWNGDFNPANFLSDGTRLTGIVDFAWASWPDPHYGLARFTIYEWVRFDRPRLFRRYRKRHGLSEADFALRSAVHAVTTLLSQPHGALTAAQQASIRGQLESDLALLHG